MSSVKVSIDFYFVHTYWFGVCVWCWIIIQESSKWKPHAKTKAVQWWFIFQFSSIHGQWTVDHRLPKSRRRSIDSAPTITTNSTQKPSTAKQQRKWKEKTAQTNKQRNRETVMLIALLPRFHVDWNDVAKDWWLVYHATAFVCILSFSFYRFASLKHTHIVSVLLVPTAHTFSLSLCSVWSVSLQGKILVFQWRMF